MNDPSKGRKVFALEEQIHSGNRYHETGGAKYYAYGPGEYLELLVDFLKCWKLASYM